MKKVGTWVVGCLILLTGCNVYHSGSASVEEAVESDSRVQVVTTDNVFFEFKRLQRENGELVGVTSPGSDAAKALTFYRQVPNGKTIKIVLPEEDIKEIHLRNKKMSNIVNIGVPIVGAAGIIGLSSDGFRPDVGN